MINKNNIAFIALIIMVTGAVVAGNAGVPADVVAGDVVLMADDTPIHFTSDGDDINVAIDETDGKLYSLSRGKSDDASGDSQVTVWIE